MAVVEEERGRQHGAGGTVLAPLRCSRCRSGNGRWKRMRQPPTDRSQQLILVAEEAAAAAAMITITTVITEEDVLKRRPMMLRWGERSRPDLDCWSHHGAPPALAAAATPRTGSCLRQRLVAVGKGTSSSRSSSSSAVVQLGLRARDRPMKETLKCDRPLRRWKNF